jgi:prepilin-type N-terminal cleavage/methylation domain-containing protein
MKRKAGFTLIEIMVSLVLVGVIAAIAGTSVITATRSYLFARENDAITQKAQLAIGRLNREFIELSDVKAVNDSQPYLIYEVPSRTAGVLADRRAIARVGNTVQMFFNVPGTTLSGLTGDILVDGVVDRTDGKKPFSIARNPSGIVNLWNMGDDIRNLFALSVHLELARPDTGGTVVFDTTVSPRNNNNSGGAALPTTSNPPPEYSGKQCFVTTAAYGDADHPVVVLLRQFRDRVLLPTGPGKALVRYYYEVGPSLAAAIEDKPIACLLVRLLVTPLAGFALLTMSRPILIPLILLLSWGLARLILRELRRRSLRWAPRLQGQRGAMLVTLIATMVVFSTLGAIMVGMFGTSALSQASGSNSLKAYYLAESGFRYAASRYIGVNMGSESANEAARDNLLETELHGKTFSLALGDGGFRIDAYPYYYKVTEIPSSNQLRTRVTGGFPLEGTSYNNGSWVQVKKTDGSIQNVQISGVSTHTYAGYNEVRFWTFSGGNWDGTIDVGATVTPVSIPDRATLTATDSDGDGLLDYIPFVASSGAAAFPARNGIFTVFVQGSTERRILSYRELDIANRRLKGIGDPSGLPLTSLTLQDPGTGPSYTKVIELMKFIRLDSTGTIGTGSAAVSRKVTYYAPIGYAKALPEPKKQFHDTMQDLTNWISGDDISKIGSFKAGTSYGSTMRVDTAQTVNTLPGGSCLKFREFQVGLNSSVARLSNGEILHTAVQQEWLRAGNYLSYDLEMKTFYTLVNPMVKHAMGLTFRLDDKGNALGFTYARGIAGYDAYGCDQDGIPFGWFWSGYANYTPVLLIWMKQYAKQESGLSVVQSPCSLTPPTTIGEPPLCSRATKAILTTKAWSFWENGERVRFTNTGGSLPPGIVAGRDYYIRKILYDSNTYLYLFSNETGALNFDPLWPGLQNITDTGSGTTTIIVQDPIFTKLAHQVLTSGNEYLGLIASLSYLKSWATFMARVNEAPSVSFIDGGGTAGREILSGETVYQTASNLPGGTVNAKYRVMRSPLYRAAKSGSRLWASGTEQGVLLLERISGEPLSNPATAPFTAGSKIFVGEHPGGTHAGTVGVPGGVTDAVFRARDNWLLFSVGDPTGKDPADINPFNNYRGPVLRNSILWPADNPEETVINTDNFTLLRFSDYVNTSLSCKVNGVDQTGIYCLTGFYSKENTGSAGDVLRFAIPDGSMFYSPQSGTVFPAGQAEFGLHAYGMDGHFTEFDDFAFQFGPGYGITRKGFLMPIQQ